MPSSPAPGAASSASVALRDDVAATSSIAIAPPSPRPSDLSVAMTSDAASRATSQATASPAGSTAAPGHTTTCVARSSERR
jgi:hypothetical protein